MVLLLIFLILITYKIPRIWIR